MSRERGDTALAMLDSLEDELQAERKVSVPQARSRGQTAAALDDLDALADTLTTEEPAKPDLAPPAPVAVPQPVAPEPEVRDSRAESSLPASSRASNAGGEDPEAALAKALADAMESVENGEPSRRNTASNNPNFNWETTGIRGSLLGETPPAPAAPATDLMPTPVAPPTELPPATFDAPPALSPMTFAAPQPPEPIKPEPAQIAHAPLSTPDPVAVPSLAAKDTVASTNDKRKAVAPEQAAPAQQGALISKFFPKKETAGAATITPVAAPLSKGGDAMLDDLLADKTTTLKRPASLFDDASSPSSSSAAAAPAKATVAPAPQAQHYEQPAPAPAPAPAPVTSPLSFLPPVRATSPSRPAVGTPASAGLSSPAPAPTPAPASQARNPFESPAASARTSVTVESAAPSPSPAVIFASPAPALVTPQTAPPPALARKGSVLLVTPVVPTAPQVVLTPDDSDEQAALASAGLAPVVSIKGEPNDSPLMVREPHVQQPYVVRLATSLHSLLECGVTGSVPQSTAAAKAMREAVGELELAADLDPISDHLRDDVRGMIALLKGLLADPSPAVQLDFAAHARKLLTSSRRLQGAIMEPPPPQEHRKSSGLSEFEAGLRMTSAPAPASVAQPHVVPASAPAQERRDSATRRNSNAASQQARYSAAPSPASSEASRYSVTPSSAAASPSGAAAPAMPDLSSSASSSSATAEASRAAEKKTANSQTSNTAPLLVAQMQAHYVVSGWGSGKDSQPMEVPPEKPRSCMDGCIIS